jgi:hypothetical protein
MCRVHVGRPTTIVDDGRPYKCICIGILVLARHSTAD